MTASPSPGVRGEAPYLKFDSFKSNKHGTDCPPQLDMDPSSEQKPPAKLADVLEEMEMSPNDIFWEDLVDQEEIDRRAKYGRSKSLIVTAVRVKKPSAYGKQNELPKINEDADS